MGSFAIAAGSQLLGYSSQVQQTKAYNQALSRQAGQQIMSYNYDIQNIEMKRRDNFENTIDKVTQAQKQGARNVASITASVNQSLGLAGSRTGKAIEQTSQQDITEAVNSYLTNYARIDASITETERQRQLSASNTMSGIRSQVKDTPSILPTLLGIGTSYVGFKSAQETKGLMQELGGIRSWNGSNGFTQDGNFTFQSINPLDSIAGTNTGLLF